MLSLYSLQLASGLLAPMNGKPVTCGGLSLMSSTRKIMVGKYLRIDDVGITTVLATMSPANTGALLFASII